MYCPSLSSSLGSEVVGRPRGSRGHGLLPQDPPVRRDGGAGSSGSPDPSAATYPDGTHVVEGTGVAGSAIVELMPAFGDQVNRLERFIKK